MMKRIHEATSPAEWDGRRDGLLVDVFRRITSVPAVTRRCAEKRQKKKRKGDYEEESERRPKTATTHCEYVQLADKEQREKRKR